jgi:seryl-tRNA synthetase
MLRLMDKQVQIANLREIYADVMYYGDLEQEKERLNAERDEVGRRYEKEISQNARVAQDQGEYQKRADELATEYDRLDAEMKAVEAEIQKRQSCGRRIETLVDALEIAGEDFTVSLWGNMVEKVTVFEDGLVFTLTSGEDVRV